MIRWTVIINYNKVLSWWWFTFSHRNSSPGPSVPFDAATGLSRQWELLFQSWHTAMLQLTLCGFGGCSWGGVLRSQASLTPAASRIQTWVGKYNNCNRAVGSMTQRSHAWCLKPFLSECKVTMWTSGRKWDVKTNNEMRLSKGKSLHMSYNQQSLVDYAMPLPFQQS